jgi:hypothetical protein
MFDRRNLFKLILLAAFIPQLCLAEPLSSPESLYLVGYQAYLEKNYALCADEFYQATLLSSPIENKARLFLAFCQEKLGLNLAAAYQLDQLSETDFSGQDLEMYLHLARKLKTELSSLNAVYYSFLPYLGQVSYDANANKSTGTYYGGFGSLDYKTWGFFLNAEKLKMSFRNSTSGYDQTQLTAGIAKMLTDQWLAHMNAVFISASDSNYNSIQIFGGGLGYYITSMTRLTLDYYNSNYPQFTLGALKSHQFNLSVDQYFLKNPSVSLWIQLLVESIFASAPLQTDSISGFTLKSNYNRFAIDVELLTGLFQFGVTGWVGSEAFGVRNQGIVVFNALEEHRMGWSGSLMLHFSKEFSVKGTVMQETFVVSGPEIKSSGFFGGMFFRF